MFTDDDYVVEQYIKPEKVRKRLINDERADILGNFDDDDDKFIKKKVKKVKKSKEKVVVSEENPFEDGDDSEPENGDLVEDGMENDESGEGETENGEVAENDASDNEEDNNEDDEESNEDESIEEATDEQHDESVNNHSEPEQESEDQSSKKTEKSKSKAKKNKVKPTEKDKTKSSEKPVKKLDLSDDQLKALLRGASKKDKFVLYVTNLSYSTTRDTLMEFFGVAGTVKSVRIPKVRRSAFAFVEMNDITGFKNALALHNRTLDNYTIKVQISEAGKKKSANKKNILKQKNRKLAEMRNESKQFQRSGKGYDKTIKKEINQRKIQQNRRLAKKAAKK